MIAGTIAKKLTPEQIETLDIMRIKKFDDINEEGKRLLAKLTEAIVRAADKNKVVTFEKSSCIKVRENVFLVEFRPDYRRNAL